MIEWRAIPSLPGHFASSDGQVRREGDKIRKPQMARSGYYYLGFVVDGKHFKRTVHSIIAETFIGPRPFPEAQVRHLDGVRVHNAADNLIYGTALENAVDREDHGHTCRGERNGRAVLIDEDVAFIRLLYSGKAASQRELAALFQISKTQVHHIVTHKQRQMEAA